MNHGLNNLAMHGVTDLAIIEAVRAYVKLFRAGKAVLARVEPFLAANCLTPTQLGVLEALLHRGRMTHRELGRKLLTSAGNLTDVLDKLERRGLVFRARNPSDRRSVQVDLTPDGREMIERVFPRHAADIAAAMSGLTTAEQAELARLLRKLGLGASCAETGAIPSSRPDCSISND